MEVIGFIEPGITLEKVDVGYVASIDDAATGARKYRIKDVQHLDIVVDGLVCNDLQRAYYPFSFESFFLFFLAFFKESLVLSLIILLLSSSLLLLTF